MENDATPSIPIGPVAHSWLADGRRALVVRTVGVTELGPLVHGEVLLLADDPPAAAPPASRCPGSRCW